MHKTGNSLRNDVSPETKPKKWLKLVALLALVNCLNLAQVKDRSQTPVGERKQEGAVGPPQSQGCCLKLVAHSPEYPLEYPLSFQDWWVFHKSSSSLKEDKPRVRTGTGKKHKEFFTSSLTTREKGTARFTSQICLLQTLDFWSFSLIFQTLDSGQHPCSPNILNSSRNCRESFFQNHTQPSWSFQLPSLGILTTALGLPHLAPEHPCGFPSHTQLSQAHRTKFTLRSSPHHSSSPENSFFQMSKNHMKKITLERDGTKTPESWKPVVKLLIQLGFPRSCCDGCNSFPTEKEEWLAVSKSLGRKLHYSIPSVEMALEKRRMQRAAKLRVKFAWSTFPWSFFFEATSPDSLEKWVKYWGFKAGLDGQEKRTWNELIFKIPPNQNIPWFYSMERDLVFPSPLSLTWHTPNSSINQHQEWQKLSQVLQVDRKSSPPGHPELPLTSPLLLSTSGSCNPKARSSLSILKTVLRTGRKNKCWDFSLSQNWIFSLLSFCP